MPLLPVSMNTTLGTMDIETETVYIDDATVDVYSDDLLTCDNEDLITAAAASKAFPNMFVPSFIVSPFSFPFCSHLTSFLYVRYVYQMQRGFALSYYNPYGLCSFPVGEAQPYYRCHSSDLYEVGRPTPFSIVNRNSLNQTSKIKP